MAIENEIWNNSNNNAINIFENFREITKRPIRMGHFGLPSVKIVVMIVLLVIGALPTDMATNAAKYGHNRDHCCGYYFGATHMARLVARD